MILRIPIMITVMTSKCSTRLSIARDDAKFKRPTHQLDFYDKMEKFGEFLWIKAQAIAWISGAIAIIYYSNFFK